MHSNQTSNPMKTNLLFTVISGLFTIFAVMILQAQPPDSLWEHHYGGTADDQAFYAIEGQIGEYIVAGKTKSFSNGGYDAYILKLDVQGNVVWERSYGGSFQEQIESVCKAPGGGYGLAGYILSDVWLLWISEDGDSLDSRIYGGPSADQAYHITPDNGQGYVVTASYGTGFTLADQLWLLRLNYTGDTLWTRQYGGTGQEYGRKVIQTSDGGYLVTGRSYSVPLPEYSDCWAVKTNSAGDTLWTRKYGGNEEDNFNSVIETEDGYVFAGTTRSFGPGSYSFYVVRTDDDGDTIWTRSFGGPSVDLGTDIDRTEEGNFVISGYSNSFGDSYDLYLVEIDANGELQWQANYGHPEVDEIIYGCYATSDGGFIATGRTIFYTAFKEEAIVLKLGPAGSGSPDHPNAGISLNVSPNPCFSELTIQIVTPEPLTVGLSVYNALGLPIRELISGETLYGIQTIRSNVSDIPPGVYFLVLKSDRCRIIKKLLIL